MGHDFDDDDELIVGPKAPGIPQKSNKSNKVTNRMKVHVEGGATLKGYIPNVPTQKRPDLN